MPYDFRTSRRVEFAETDMAGIVHFSNFFRWMESAEHEFFRSFGVMLHSQKGSELRGYARVKAECEYSSPARYGDLLQVHLVVEHQGARSLGYVLDFELEEEGKMRAVARGRMRVVCVERGEGDGMRAAPLPDAVRRHVQVAPAEVLARLKGRPVS